MQFFPNRADPSRVAGNSNRLAHRFPFASSRPASWLAVPTGHLILGEPSSTAGHWAAIFEKKELTVTSDAAPDELPTGHNRRPQSDLLALLVRVLPDAEVAAAAFNCVRLKHLKRESRAGVKKRPGNNDHAYVCMLAPCSCSVPPPPDSGASTPPKTPPKTACRII